MSVETDNGARGSETMVTRVAGAETHEAGIEVARRETPIPNAQEVDDLGKLANILAKSGFFRDAQGGYQAFAKLLFGRDLGLSATAALTGVNIVEGKPELSANVQAQMVRSYVGVGGERYDYKIVSPKEERHERCEIEFCRTAAGGRETLGSSEFTIADAERAGLLSTRSGRPSNYQKYPANMLFARAMSNGVAFHCPEVTGGLRVYHEGEIEPAGYTTPNRPGTSVEDEIPEAEIVGDLEPAHQDTTVSDGREGAGEAEASAGETPDEGGGDVAQGRDAAREPARGPEQTNPYGARVREHAAQIGVGGAQLANVMREAAGGDPLPDERAEQLLEAMLARVPRQVAEKTIGLLEEIGEQERASGGVPRPASGAAVSGEDFAAFDPPQAA